MMIHILSACYEWYRCVISPLYLWKLSKLNPDSTVSDLIVSYQSCLKVLWCWVCCCSCLFFSFVVVVVAAAAAAAAIFGCVYLRDFSFLDQNKPYMFRPANLGG